MGLAFGILLFVLTYGPIAFMVYVEVKRQGPRGSARPVIGVRQQGAKQLRAAGQYQH
jgi:hypothetical protein